VKRDRNLNPVRIERHSRHPRDLITHQSGIDPQHDFTPCPRSPATGSGAPTPETQEPPAPGPRASLGG
jgi:hypothetical protein